MFQLNQNYQASKKKDKKQDLNYRPPAEPAPVDNTQQIEDKLKQARDSRNQAYQTGRTRAEELFARDVQGLDPKKRQAMQYEANRGIRRSTQAANRKLLGEQGMHGIGGKSGVGFAQQKELQRLAMDAQGGVTRDLDKLDVDERNRNRAAMLALEQGEASQDQIDRQMIIDQLNLEEERKRQRLLEDQFNRAFSRV